MNADLNQIIWLTLFSSFLSTCIVFIPGIPLAYCLSRYNFKGKALISSLVGLPMVLPPTAVGFVLLDFLASDGYLGKLLHAIGIEVILTFKAVVLAGAAMSMPLIVRTAKVAFDGVPPNLEQVIWTLGVHPLKTILIHTLPMAYKGLWAAFILGFTRAMGEFGATIVLAGNIPGKTRTISAAIFSAQQSGQDDKAYFLIAIATIVGFSAILISEFLSKSKTY